MHDLVNWALGVRYWAQQIQLERCSLAPCCRVLSDLASVGYRRYRSSDQHELIGGGDLTFACTAVTRWRYPASIEIAHVSLVFGPK